MINSFVFAISVTRSVSIRFASLWRRFDLLYSIFGRHEKQQRDKDIELMHKFSRRVIVQRRELLMNSKNAESNGDEAVGTKQKMAFLDILLRSEIDGKPLSDVEILEEVTTFMFAGHDTTTAAISAICYALSRHEAVQNKLFKEIVDVFGTDKQSPITYHKLNELKYMDLVIKETLRLYPPVPAIGRRIDHDIKLGKRKTIN